MLHPTLREGGRGEERDDKNKWMTRKGGRDTHILKNMHTHPPHGSSPPTHTYTHKLHARTPMAPHTLLPQVPRVQGLPCCPKCHGFRDCPAAPSATGSGTALLPTFHRLCMSEPNASASSPLRPSGLARLMSPMNAPLRKNFMMGSVCVRHWRLEFIKHVLPRLDNPA